MAQVTALSAGLNGIPMQHAAPMVQPSIITSIYKQTKNLNGYKADVRENLKLKLHQKEKTAGELQTHSESPLQELQVKCSGQSHALLLL